MQKCKNSKGEGKNKKENNFDFGFLHLMFWFVGYIRYAADMWQGLATPSFPFPFHLLLLQPFSYHFTSQLSGEENSKTFFRSFLKIFCCRIVQSYRHKANICIANKRATVEEIFNIRN